MKDVFVLTNGIKFIKQDFNGDPSETMDMSIAHEFNSIYEANIYLNSKLMKRLKKHGGHIYHVAKPSDIIAMKNRGETNNSPDDTETADELLQMPKNAYMYQGQTYAEKNNINLERLLTECVEFFSQIDTYISNMKFLLRECDLKILDIRHYLRELERKPNACTAAKLTYLQQQLEKERWEYKRNMELAQKFLCLERLKNQEYIDIISKVANTPYKYSRYSKDSLEGIVSKTLS